MRRFFLHEQIYFVLHFIFETSLDTQLDISYVNQVFGPEGSVLHFNI